MLAYIVTIMGILTLAHATAELVETKGISYAEGRERCQLDIYRPKDGGVHPCLLWFHGGGMTSGTKDDAVNVATCSALAEQGIVVAAVNYRLSPKNSYPAYLEDAAAAFHWVKKNAATYQGNAEQIFLAGHSAGGYLVTMLSSDARWLAKQGDQVRDIAGAVSLSGQMVTHFTIRAERGLADTTVVCDADAPLHHAGEVCAPQLILYAEKDMAMRAEENVLYLAARKAANRTQVRGWMVPGTDHGSIGNDVGKPGNVVGKMIAEFVLKKLK